MAGKVGLCNSFSGVGVQMDAQHIHPARLVQLAPQLGRELHDPTHQAYGGESGSEAPVGLSLLLHPISLVCQVLQLPHLISAAIDLLSCSTNTILVNHQLGSLC